MQTTAKSTIRRMTIQLQKDNTTVKTIQVWQYNCKKYNTRMTIQL